MSLQNKQKLIPLKNCLITVTLCALLALCMCFPAQSQIVKLPFLGIVAVEGIYYLALTQGKAISQKIWIWMGLYLAYNLIPCLHFFIFIIYKFYIYILIVL